MYFDNIKRYLHELEIGEEKDETENEDTVEEEEDYSVDTNTEEDTSDEEEEDYSISDENEPDAEEPQEETLEDEEDEDYSIDTENEDNEETSEDGEMSEEGEDEEDYSIDASVDSEDDDNEDNSSDDNSEDNSGDDQTTDQNNDEIKKIEDELFNFLSDDQKNIREIELKKNFSTLYSDILLYTDRISVIPKTEDNIPIITNVLESLFKLKEYVYDYIQTTFTTNGYVENSIIYQKFLVSLSAIRNILEEMSKISHKSL